MDPCVYATQFPIWLKAASARTPSELVCFRSNKRWATAAKLLERHGTRPILFREQQDSAEELTCRYVAELVEVHFRDRLENDADPLAWLDEKLWLQRDTIKGLERTERFPTWEAQFKTWEIDSFMKADTWYVIRNLREIKPLPLPRLRKLDGDHPLAPNYIRGYALCHYPAAEVKVVDGSATV